VCLLVFIGWEVTKRCSSRDNDGLGLYDPGIGVRFSYRGSRLFSSPKASGSGAFLPSYPMGTGAPSIGVSGRGVKLTTYFHIVLRLRVGRDISPVPNHTLHNLVLN
jgi:hypothetical protein